MKRSAPSSRPRAFTLVELLVVIAIITLLIGSLLPVLSKARQSVPTLNCLNQQRQVYLAFGQYASDSDGLYPVLGDAGNSSGAGTSGIWASWVGRLMAGRYLQAIIPGSGKLPYDPPTSGAVIHTGLLGCPSMKVATGWGSIVGLASNPLPAENIGTNFGLNYELWRVAYPQKVLGMTSTTNYINVNVDRVPKPSGTLMIGDQAFKGIGGSTRLRRLFPRVTDTTANTWENVDFRHGVEARIGSSNGSHQVVNYDGVANLLFLDGHASSVHEDVVPINGTGVIWRGGL